MTEQEQQIEETGVIDKEGLEQEKLEKLFHQIITNFKLRWISKDSPVSQAGLYNYAISLMRYEFHKKFDDDTSKRIVESYKP